MNLAGPWELVVSEEGAERLWTKLGLSETDKQPIAVDLGSHFRDVDPSSAKRMVLVLRQASAITGRPVVVFGADAWPAGYTDKADSASASSCPHNTRAKPHVHFIKNFLPYHSILHRFAALLHCGGAGTTMAAAKV